MVHPADRGHRLAGRLLTALEEQAAGLGLRLLVLDTETDSPAERLYETAGWTRVGSVPDYATDPAGSRTRRRSSSRRWAADGATDSG